MHFEKRVTGGHLALDPGDHERLKVDRVVDSLPINSPEITNIMRDLKFGIECAEFTFEGYRRRGNELMFEAHGEIIAMQGLLQQIERFRAMTGHASATPKFDTELYGSLHDEPVIPYSEPQLTVLTTPQPEFDPGGPSIA